MEILEIVDRLVVHNLLLSGAWLCLDPEFLVFFEDRSCAVAGPQVRLSSEVACSFTHSSGMVIVS